MAVVDIALPGLDGIETARQVHDSCPGTHILMLSMHANSEHIYQALRAGANGYVLKESAGAELVAAIRTVRAGKVYLSGRIGWLAWLGIHLAFLTGYRNRLGAVLSWAIAFSRETRRERAFTMQQVAPGGADLYRNRTGEDPS